MPLNRCSSCGGLGIATLADGGGLKWPEWWVHGTQDGQYCECYTCRGLGYTQRSIQNADKAAKPAPVEQLQKQAGGADSGGACGAAIQGIKELE